MPETNGTRDEWLLFAWLLAVLSAATLLTRQRMFDWSSEVAGGHTLFSHRWAKLLADNPNAQTGPITHLLAWPIEQLGTNWGKAVIFVLGAGVLAMLVVLARDVPGASMPLALGGAALAAWWPQLGSFGHLDDAIVLTLTVLAVWAVLGGRDRVAGTFVGVALGAKPTAVFLLAITLPFGAWRRRDAWVPLLLAIAIAVVVYGPFIAGAAPDLDALRPKVYVRPDSVLRLVVDVNARPSSLFRTAQLVAVIAASVWAMRRHGVAAVVLAGTAARVVLDPGAWAYYTVGFVLGALLFDLRVTRWRIPWTTLAAAVVLVPPWAVGSDLARAWMRLVACVAAVLVLWAVRPASTARRQ